MLAACSLLTPGVNKELAANTRGVFRHSWRKPRGGGYRAAATSMLRIVWRAASTAATCFRHELWRQQKGGIHAARLPAATKVAENCPPPAILAVCYATASMQVADRHNLSYDGSIYPPPLWRWINTGRHLPVAAG